MKSYCVTIQKKATKQYFPVVLFIMLYKMVLYFESVDEIRKCDHLANESYWEVLSGDAVYCAAQGGGCRLTQSGLIWTKNLFLLKQTLRTFDLQNKNSNINVWYTLLQYKVTCMTLLS